MKNFYTRLLLALLFIGINHTIPIAQKLPIIIQGRVMDAETNHPIPKVNVFLSGTTIGTSTDGTGKYTIKDSIPKGRYSLVFSHVKYGTDAQAIEINAPRIFNINMALVPRKGTLNEVTIKGKKDRTREKYLKTFKREFLGTSSAAYNCKILNPWVIDIKELNDTLYASSEKEIIVENPILGYKIHCLLKSFSNVGYQTSYNGYYRFEKLKAKNSKKSNKWYKKRLSTFYGSFRHFVCALLYERVKKDGFELYKTDQSPEVSKKIVLQNINPKNLYTQKDNETHIVIPNFVRVIYNREREEPGFITWSIKQKMGAATTIHGRKSEPQGSWISITGNKLKVSELGIIMDNPAKLRSFGYWAWERVGDMLPADFFPAEMMQAIKISKIQTISQLKRYTFNRPQEKVYLHQDKGYYAVGDTLWFSGYVVDAISHKPSALSRIVYVDLIDENNQVKQQLKVFNDRGKATGQFSLGYGYKPGNYRLRAYTKLMEGQNKHFFFNQRFEIGLQKRKNRQAKFTYKSQPGNTDEVINYQLKLPDHAKKSIQLVIKSPGKSYQSQTIKVDASGNIAGSITIAPSEKTPYIEFIAKSSNKKKPLNKRFFVPVHRYQKRVTFFPEGGDLVAGITNFVAFKAVTPQGKSTDMAGSIVDDKGTQVTTFKSTHAGMGRLAFMPQKGRQYKAVISHSSGAKQSIDLPSPKENGYVLHINNSSSDLVVVTVRSTYKKTQSFSLIGHSRGEPVYTISGETKRNKRYTIKILKSSLPAGIVNFTLFDKGFQPLCERLVFIRKRKELDIEVASDKNSYYPRDKVELSFKVKSFKYDTLPANLSVSVIDQNIVPETPHQSNILSSLLLTSDLKGYIENPNFYFKDRSEQTLQALDLLMMTHGWRRFTWKKIFSDNEKVPKINVENGFTISGTVKASSGWPVKGGTVTIIAADVKLFKTTQTDDQGRFKFDNLVLVNNTKVSLRAFNAKGKPSAKIELDQTPAPIKVMAMDDRPRLHTAPEKASNYLNRLARLKKGELLEEVQVKAKKIKGPQYERMQGQLHSRPNYRLRPDQTNGGTSAATNFIDYINGKIPGLVIRNLYNSNGERVVYYRQNTNQYGGKVVETVTAVVNGKERTIPTKIERQKQPIFLLDGIQVPLNALEALPLDDIAVIDMLSSTQGMVYGPDAAYGVMAVYTKRGKDGKIRTIPTNPGQVTFNFSHGYFKARQFYVPPYNEEAFVKQKLPDLRSTIYWNPYIEVKNGEAKVSFFNATAPATYKVVVEGISKEGEIGRQIYTLKVKEKEER